MHFERLNRRMSVPGWAVIVVAVHLGLVGAVLLIGRFSGFDTPVLCTFRRLTGLPCPTCGSARMVLAILDGRVSEALRLNPLVFVVMTGLLVGAGARLGLGYRLVLPMSGRARPLWVCGLLVAVAANWTYLLICMRGA